METITLSNIESISQSLKSKSVFLGIDVESGHPKNLDRIMSIGYAVVDTKGEVLEKSVIYFPFHITHLEYSGSEYDTFTFWCKGKNINVLRDHMKSSNTLGFHPMSREAPDENSEVWKVCMKERMQIFSDTLYRIQSEYNVLAIITDCMFDTTVINHLLYKFLDEEPLTMKRSIDSENNRTFSWGMKCIDTGSFVASQNSNVTNLNSSESSFMKSNHLSIPKTVSKHTHSPDDDCERMLIEFLIMWNHCLGSML